MTLPARYTLPAIVLHWVIAVFILANIAIGLLAGDLPDAWQRPFIDTHKSIGLTVLGLAILRLLWRLTHKPPAMPSTYRPWERRAAHAAHWALYALIFAVPFTGWLHDSAWKGGPTHPLKIWWVIPWFRFHSLQALPPAEQDKLHAFYFQIHESLAYLLLAIFVVHVAGALKHQFLDGEPELQRMLPEPGSATAEAKRA